MTTVVSVEISDVNRNILKSWWEQTNQTGELIDLSDVQELNGDKLEQMINTFVGKEGSVMFLVKRLIGCPLLARPGLATGTLLGFAAFFGGELCPGSALIGTTFGGTSGGGGGRTSVVSDSGSNPPRDSISSGGGGGKTVELD